MLDTAHKFKLGSEVRHIIYDIDTDVLNESVSFQIPYIHLIIYLSKFGQVQWKFDDCNCAMKKIQRLKSLNQKWYISRNTQIHENTIKYALTIGVILVVKCIYPPQTYFRNHTDTNTMRNWQCFYSCVTWIKCDSTLNYI